MERFHEHCAKASKHLRTADHMIAVSYPLVKDPKLLLAVMDNIYLALDHAMSAILHFDRIFHRIPPFQDTFTSRFSMFKEKSVPLHAINNEYLQSILDSKNVLAEHRKAPVEFRKEDSFVICDAEYRMRTLTVPEIKQRIVIAKRFNTIMEKIVTQHDALFERRS